MILRINELILKSGLKKQHIAKLLGVTEPTLTRWCLGYTYPNAKILKQLSEILKVDVSEFFYEE